MKECEVFYFKKEKNKKTRRKRNEESIRNHLCRSIRRGSC